MRIHRPALLLFLLLAAAPAAHARDLKLGVVLGGKKGHVSVAIGHPSHGHAPRAVRSCSIHPRCAPARVWVPGRYETVEHRVWIPERREKVWVEPVFETRRDHCGRAITVMVREGRWTTVVRPGHYETTCERVYVRGGYETRCKTY